MKGNCLCGEVSFSLTGKLPLIYQCHCSLCRKVSGSSSNSAIIVSAENFIWCSGQNKICSYVTETGFSSDFCGNCGSPVPNLCSNKKEYWVPAGLLVSDAKTEVVAHVYTGSRADWDIGFLGDYLLKFNEMPSDPEWRELLDKNA